MISCAEYDAIEIVCMYQYPIKLTLKSGDILNGIGCDTKRDQANNECMLINIADKHKLVNLDDIIQLDVCIENPHIKQVIFK